MPDLGWVDWTLIAVLALSVLLGLARGFVFEALLLGGWVVAYFAAVWFAPQVGSWLPVGAPRSALNHAAAFALCFLAAILAWAVAARVIRLLIRATPLSVPDRLLGAVFGLLRGGLLLLVVATVVAYTPAAQSAPWQASHGARWLDQALAWVKPLLPTQAADWLPD